MDFWQTIKVVFARWYITFPAFFAALGIAGIVYASVPTQYVSTSVLVLTAPRTGPTEQTDDNHPNPITNPLLNFDNGLSLSASILIQALTSPETAATVGVSPGGSTTYEVTNGTTNPELLQSGPFIFIQGTSTTPENAEDVVRRLSAVAIQDLAEREKQLNAPASTYITLSEVVPATSPQVLEVRKLRAAGAAGVLAVLAGLAAAFAFESIATRQERRQPDQEDSRQHIFDHNPEAARLVSSSNR